MNLFEWADTQHNYIAFDLEIAKEVEGDDWASQRPLGISCAATFDSDGNTKVWHGVSQMTSQECQKMTDYLLGMQAQNYVIVTWNGLGFDFDVLAEECQDENYTEAIKRLALNHIDVAFAMFCDKGFMVGLETAAKGMGLEGKTEGMHGDLAPVMWKQGEKEREKVLEYVAQDAKVTADVYAAIRDNNRLRWVSRSGRTNFWIVGEKILTVLEAMKTPEPDTSWMSNPWKREKFYGWTNS